jgi:hypothetical protein
MKKLFLIFSIVLLLLSCDNGSVETDNKTPNPFVGTWVTENNWLYTFTKTIATAKTNDGQIYYKGTYIYDDDNITISVNTEESVYQGDTIIYPYIISGNVLFLMGIPLTKTN